ncbi:hypothetical protein LXL04_031475 [Taraxacum kok-saghyz]
MVGESTSLLPDYFDTSTVVASPDDIFSILEALEGVSDDFTAFTQSHRRIVAPKKTSVVICTGGARGGVFTQKQETKGGVGVSPSPDQEGCENSDGIKMSHVTVERNRRKQMNEHLTVLGFLELLLVNYKCTSHSSIFFFCASLRAIPTAGSSMPGSIRAAETLLSAPRRPRADLGVCRVFVFWKCEEVKTSARGLLGTDLDRSLQTSSKLSNLTTRPALFHRDSSRAHAHRRCSSIVAVFSPDPRRSSASLISGAPLLLRFQPSRPSISSLQTRPSISSLQTADFCRFHSDFTSISVDFSLQTVDLFSTNPGTSFSLTRFRISRAEFLKSEVSMNAYLKSECLIRIVGFLSMIEWFQFRIINMYA